MDAVRQIPDLLPVDRKQHVTDIVRDAGRRLGRFIRARVSSEAEAEDILQEVWQQLITTLEVEPIEQVGAWLYTVARRRIIDRYRKPRAASLDELGEEAGDAGELELAAIWPREDPTPETAQLHRVFWERLQTALAGLPPEQRQVFVWHELDELSFQEIATLTGENVNTLLSRKRYAVLHLRRALEPFRAEFFSPPQPRI